MGFFKSQTLKNTTFLQRFIFYYYLMGVPHVKNTFSQMKIYFRKEPKTSIKRYTCQTLVADQAITVL